MTFRTATDRLLALGVSLADVAEALGVVHGTVRQARLDPASPSHRKPPAGWRERLSELARSRGHQLIALADKLEP